MKNKNKKDNSKAYGGVLGMCIGLSVGTALGAVTQNFGLWMPAGLTVGMCFGFLLAQDHKDE